MNIKIVVGRLGKDPEVTYSGAGTPVAKFSVATNEREKDDSGNWVDVAEWHDCVAFGKTADFIGQHFSKGSSIAIQGRQKTRNWTDKEGQKRYRTECIVDRASFAGGKGDG